RYGLKGPPEFYAEGVADAPSGWAWVGERGPELVNFRGGETVLNHQRSVAMRAEEARRKTKPAPWEESKVTRPDRAESLPEPGKPDERKATAKAAKAVGASARTTAKAKAVQRDAPDLAAKVRSGEMALDAADRERKRRVDAEPKPEPVKPSPVMLTLRTHD